MSSTEEHSLHIDFAIAINSKAEINYFYYRNIDQNIYSKINVRKITIGVSPTMDYNHKMSIKSQY